MDSAKRLMAIYRNKVVRLTLRAQLSVLLFSAAVLCFKNYWTFIFDFFGMPLVADAIRTAMKSQFFAANGGLFWIFLQAVVIAFMWLSALTVATRVVYGISVLFRDYAAKSYLIENIPTSENNYNDNSLFYDTRDNRLKYQVLLQ